MPKLLVAHLRFAPFPVVSPPIKTPTPPTAAVSPKSKRAAVRMSLTPDKTSSVKLLTICAAITPHPPQSTCTK